MTTTSPSTDRRSATAGAKNPTTAYLAGLFAVYLVLLAWIVLWKLEVPYVGEGALRQIKLVPFVPSGTFGASAPSEVVANILLFVPFGLYLGVLAPSWRWWKAAAAIAGASLVLEAAQYLLSVGSADVTDLIANTAGGLVGLGLLAMMHRRLAARTITVVTTVLRRRHGPGPARSRGLRRLSPAPRAASGRHRRLPFRAGGHGAAGCNAHVRVG